MPIRIAVVVESPVDFRHVTGLIDRKVREHAPDWWDDGQLAAEREYRGLTPGTEFTCWRELKALARERGISLHGGALEFDRPQGLHFDYNLGHKAVALCALLESRPDVLLLVRDMDQQPKERRRSLHFVRDKIPAASMKIVLALPRAKREAWALAGWQPQSTEEEKAFAEVREELAFHPCQSSEQLDAAEHGATRDAKRVLGKLTKGSMDRESKCWLETPWATLREFGQENGLAEFLNEVKAVLVPEITGIRR
ncbi:MAG TPA: hypothetical protein VGO11_14825 [Chthoniobacteraceae bacterium]|jgi:hypothetical protein|nr:hypothetical protein [Chthoniobacteraceae bacterium]